MIYFVPVDVLMAHGQILVDGIRDTRDAAPGDVVVTGADERELWHVDEFLRYAERLPETRLDLVIGHATRCGSTLLSRYCECLPDTGVSIEPRVLGNTLLVTEPGRHRERLLQALIRAVTFALNQAFDQAVLKLPSMVHRHADVLHDAPALQRVYIYRQPREIFVSLYSNPPDYLQDCATKRGVDLYIAHTKSAFPVDRVERTARHIAENMARTLASLDRSGADGILLINYDELADDPESAFDRLGLPLKTQIDREALKMQTRRHAKHPDREFVDDRSAKRQAIAADHAAVVDQYCQAQYARLEAYRNQQREQSV